MKNLKSISAVTKGIISMVVCLKNKVITGQKHKPSMLDHLLEENKKLINNRH